MPFTGFGEDARERCLFGDECVSHLVSSTRDGYGKLCRSRTASTLLHRLSSRGRRACFSRSGTSGDLGQCRLDARYDQLWSPFHLPLSEPQDRPAVAAQAPVHLAVAMHVAFDLEAPRQGHALGEAIVVAPVPEIAIEKDGYPVPDEDDVRSANDRSEMLAIPVAQRIKLSAEHADKVQLEAGVSPGARGHRIAPTA